MSTETIYNCIYAQPVGQLKKDLIQALRHAHNKRVPRSKGQDRRGQIPGMLRIYRLLAAVNPGKMSDGKCSTLMKFSACLNCLGRLMALALDSKEVIAPSGISQRSFEAGLNRSGVNLPLLPGPQK